jgi:hypothetical protein
MSDTYPVRPAEILAGGFSSRDRPNPVNMHASEQILELQLLDATRAVDQHVAVRCRPPKTST